MLIHLQKNAFEATVQTEGAYIEDFTLGGRPVFYPLSLLQDASGKAKKRGGCHPCFPNFGAAGAITELKQHGYARDLSWEVLRQDEAAVELRLMGEGSYAEVEAQLLYELTDTGLKTRLRAINHGQTTVDIAPGFHPYFQLGEGELELRVNDEVLNCADLAGTLFRDHVRELSLREKRVDFQTQQLERFAVWTDQLGDYVCVEPTYALDSFAKRPEDNLKLQPGASASFAYELSVKPVEA